MYLSHLPYRRVDVKAAIAWCGHVCEIFFVLWSWRERSVASWCWQHHHERSCTTTVNEWCSPIHLHTVKSRTHVLHLDLAVLHYKTNIIAYLCPEVVRYETILTLLHQYGIKILGLSSHTTYDNSGVWRLSALWLHNNCAYSTYILTAEAMKYDLVFEQFFFFFCQCIWGTAFSMHTV